MSQVKNFEARVISGTTGYLINVKGEVNCGQLTVEPTLTRKEPQGINKKILLLDVYPASKGKGGSYSDAEYSENISAEDQYDEVHLIDPDGDVVDKIKVKPA